MVGEESIERTVSEEQDKVIKRHRLGKKHGRFGSTVDRANPSMLSGEVPSVHSTLFPPSRIFWSLYNNILHRATLRWGQTSIVLKIRLSPNGGSGLCYGGKWTTVFPRGSSWLHSDRLLAMIGEQFDHGEEIYGEGPRQDKISFWMKNASDESAQVKISIGKQWKEFIDYHESIGFIVHDNTTEVPRINTQFYVRLLDSHWMKQKPSKF